MIIFKMLQITPPEPHKKLKLAFPKINKRGVSTICVHIDRVTEDSVPS